MDPTGPPDDLRVRILRSLKHKTRNGASRLARNRAFHVNWKRVRSREYLNLGCGYSPSERFINLDYEWHRKIDVCWDIRRGLPRDDASLKGIVSEHCLEHLSLDDGFHVLGECARVLRPGGTLRVVVPDGELYLSNYSRIHGGDNTVQIPFADRDEYRGVFTPIMSVNRVFGQFGHRVIYDYETLHALISRQGLVNVERSCFGAGRDPALLIDTERRAPESLYVEATTP